MSARPSSWNMAAAACAALALWAAAGCDPSTEAPTAGPARVNAPVVAARAAVPEGWCDRAYAPGAGPRLTLPATSALTEGPTTAQGRPRWVNLWATWCKPCVHEMPLIARWRQARFGVGAEAAVEFVSVDEEPADVAAFLKNHAELAGERHRRLTDAEALPGLIRALGLEADAALPVHVFLDATGAARCVRAGGVAESDLPIVRALLF